MLGRRGDDDVKELVEGLDERLKRVEGRLEELATAIAERPPVESEPLPAVGKGKSLTIEAEPDAPQAAEPEAGGEETSSPKRDKSAKRSRKGRKPRKEAANQPRAADEENAGRRKKPRKLAQAGSGQASND